MIVEILSQKYKCNCGRGLAQYEEPGILDKLNFLIEWDQARYPLVAEKQVLVDIPDPANPGDLLEEGVQATIYKEDKNFLGGVEELKPGNCFLLDGQIIAIDSPDRIVLVLSKTGRNSLDRIVEEVIKPEYSLVFGNEEVDVKWEAISKEERDKEFKGICPIPYPEYVIWKNRFVAGREKNLLVDDHLNVKVEVKTKIIPIPVTLVLTEWEVAYSTEDFDEEDTSIIQAIAHRVLAWFIQENSRSKVAFEPLGGEKEQMERFIEARQREWEQKKKKDSK